MKALKSQVRTCNDVHLDPGEMQKKQHGPGVVKGRDEQTFVVKHGFQIIVVHPCHIKPTHVPVSEETDENDQSGTAKTFSESKHNGSSFFEQEKEIMMEINFCHWIMHK